MTRIFTPAEGRIILDSRAAGRCWRDIGKQFGTAGKVCQRHLIRVLGVPDPKPVQIGRSKPRHLPSMAGRDPLRPGASESWQAITAGTCIEGSAYR